MDIKILIAIIGVVMAGAGIGNLIILSVIDKKLYWKKSETQITSGYIVLGSLFILFYFI